MPAPKQLPDLLQRTREVSGEEVLYRFANGLTIKTEIFNKPDRLRILPLGSPQGALMNHVLNFPHTVQGKRVFEPFAGSGAIGFAALSAGAAHVDFLDVNPRASEFHSENAALNQLGDDLFSSILGDIAVFVPDQKYELVLSSPGTASLSFSSCLPGRWRIAPSRSHPRKIDPFRSTSTAKRTPSCSRVPNPKSTDGVPTWFGGTATV
jgi:hypothetical protein